MCEILLRVRDKVNDADPYLDAQCLKRGDVVVVVENGWPWSEAELTNPDWRILKLPNVSVEFAEAFLAPEVDTDPTRPSRMLRRRALRVAVNALPAAVRTWLADETRAQPTRTMNVTEAQLWNLREGKTPLPDPNVIG